ncbi:DNA mismatch repair protein MutL [Serendipita vermifera]|nr:DNA mismatch repair protein MutL [Serendipita vermifera]
MADGRIKAIDKTSVHRITSSQVVVDLQTAVKELVENSLDAGASVIEVRFKENGLKSVEVIDNGSGIAKEDYESVALKHHTSKLSSFEDLTTVETFGFRGEALASLCALCESVVITTATASDAPMGTILQLDRTGRVINKEGRVARQKGTTVAITNLFAPLPVRRKEFERHAKREYGKALSLLTAYALFPSVVNGQTVKFTVSHISETGKKLVQIQTDGSSQLKSSVTALWGSKAMDNVVPLDLDLKVEPDSASLRRRGLAERHIDVKVHGLVSNFAVGCGRSSNDRQFFFVNGRPCNLVKIQKTFNEVYKTFNSTQSPFVVVNFKLPTNACDINVSPDKRTIFLHSEQNLIDSLQAALVKHFDEGNATFAIQTQEQDRSMPTTSKRTSSRSNDTKFDDSSPSKTSSAPSSDSLPTTQPVSLQILSSNAGLDHSDVTLDPIPLSESPPRISVPGISSEPNMKPTFERAAHHEPDALNEEPFNESTPSATQKKIRSTSTSSASPEDPRPPIGSKKAVQMVLSTTGASWSLDKIGGERQGRNSDTISTSYNVKSARDRGRKKFTATLSQLRRGVEASEAGGPEEVDEFEEEDEMTPEEQPQISIEEESEIIEQSHQPRSTSDRKRALESLRNDRLRKTGSKSTNNTPVESKDEDKEEDIEENFVAEEAPRRGQKRSRASSEASVPPTVDSQMEDELENETPSVAITEGTTLVPNPLSKRADVGTKIQLPEPAPVLDLSEEQHSSVQLTEDTPLEIIRTNLSPVLTMECNLAVISQRWSAYSSSSMRPKQPMEGSEVEPVLARKTSMDPTQDEGAEDLLSRVIQKQDFGKMEILGQFNLGFIIVRSRKYGSTPANSNPQSKNAHDNKDGGMEDGPEMDDLFIVDQHAADEKYNFETLQQTTKIESQKLLRPRPLDLSASDRLVALENLEVLQNNGFEVALEKDEDAMEEDDNEGSVQGRLMLVSQPVSKSTVFDMSDLSELLHLMQDKPSGSMVRCSKARAMFASRACRKSVMIGHPLTRSQMITIVRHMGTMEQPWNCPHGRPTMRHLMRMNTYLKSSKVVMNEQDVGYNSISSRKVNWKSIF